MLIRFLVENYLSFNEEVEFSMVPGRARKHGHHIVQDPAWNGINLLKAAAIYGANASGKSNLVKAIEFSRDLVVKGTKPRKSIDIECFKLDKSCLNKTSKFQYEFKSRGKSYVYGFELDRNRIHSEWLYTITSDSQKLLFERNVSDEGEADYDFKNIKFENEDDKQFLHFIARGTSQNQLFLTETINREAVHFQDAYYWFENVLTIIFPGAKWMRLEETIETGKDLSDAFLEYLQLFDTGIEGLRLCEIDFENELKVPLPIKDEIAEDLESADRIIIHSSSNQRFIVKRNEEDKSIEAFQLMTEHKMRKGDGIALLDFIDESDGTQRLMDLIPALIDLQSGDKVFVIDELDRSLHPMLSTKIIELFLNNERERESQLIVTTHESSLLDLELLRRDEIWFMEKNQNGASLLYSLEEFAPRYDKNIRKGYLHGRFGAIPIVRNVNELGWTK